MSFKKGKINKKEKERWPEKLTFEKGVDSLKTIELFIDLIFMLKRQTNNIIYK